MRGTTKHYQDEEQEERKEVKGQKKSTSSGSGIILAPSRESEQVAMLEARASRDLLHLQAPTDVHFFPESMATASAGITKVWYV